MRVDRLCRAAQALESKYWSCRRNRACITVRSRHNSVASRRDACKKATKNLMKTSEVLKFKIYLTYVLQLSLFVPVHRHLVLVLDDLLKHSAVLH